MTVLRAVTSVLVLYRIRVMHRIEASPERSEIATMGYVIQARSIGVVTIRGF
jgi:hypothetical protein